MSQENLAALRRLYEGWTVGDVWAQGSLYDPHIVYLSQADEPDPGPHYGLNAFTAYSLNFLEGLDNWRIEAKEYRQAGDTCLVRIRRSATGTGSGVQIDDEAFHVWTFRGGSVIRLEVFKEEQQALASVGLGE